MHPVGGVEVHIEALANLVAVFINANLR